MVEEVMTGADGGGGIAANMTAGINSLVMLISPVGMFIIALVSLILVLRTSHGKRETLVNTFYHHVTRAILSLELFLGEQNADMWDEFRKGIESDTSYTPYLIQSSADNLTYDQMIEVLAVLKGVDEKYEEKLLSYFHNDQFMHAVADSFNFAKDFSMKRKLKLLDSFKHACEWTLSDAKYLEPIFKEQRKKYFRTGRAQK
ncbi:MAG: hypothetical protein OD918_06550 [Gammaproteobacteria bacterium]